MWSKKEKELLFLFCSFASLSLMEICVVLKTGSLEVMQKNQKMLSEYLRDKIKELRN